MHFVSLTAPNQYERISDNLMKCVSSEVFRIISSPELTTMKSVVQEEITGCAIASSAAIAGVSYVEAKEVANRLGIFAYDEALWSETYYIRRLLNELGISADKCEKDFSDWKSLPDCALLAIKWHREKRKPFWHWVVFVRDGEDEYVLDSKWSLKSNVRTDFGRMNPKWYIAVRELSTTADFGQ